MNLATFIHTFLINYSESQQLDCLIAFLLSCLQSFFSSLLPPYVLVDCFEHQTYIDPASFLISQTIDFGSFKVTRQLYPKTKTITCIRAYHSIEKDKTKKQTMYMFKFWPHLYILILLILNHPVLIRVARASIPRHTNGEKIFSLMIRFTLKMQSFLLINNKVHYSSV